MTEWVLICWDIKAVEAFAMGRELVAKIRKNTGVKKGMFVQYLHSVAGLPAMNN